MNLFGQRLVPQERLDVHITDSLGQNPLVLCVGPRRLKVNPIYSQHLRGGGKGANNVHKFERYLRHSSTHVATIYGPVTFGNLPCMLLKESNDEQGKHSPFTWLGAELTS